jgi:subtilisin family serine protease
MLLPLLAAARPAGAVVSWDPDTDAVSVINLAVGAGRFYDAGYYGFNAVIANVEAGHVWPLHESLTNVTVFVNDPNIGPASGLYDYHATMVGMELVGLGPYDANRGYSYVQFGMAPGAQLISTAIATGWDGNNGSFNLTTGSFVYGYQTVMQTGVQVPLAPGITSTRTADVINSSWGYDDLAGTEQPTKIIDALAYANHQTVVLAAGNHDGNSPVPVIGPASGYNSISVAALGTVNSTPAFGSAASFSNSGPIDFYNPQTGVTVPGVRCGVDIAAPGTDMVLAAYTGTTGTNPLGTDPVPGETDLYWIGAAGTSMAAPIVAGGAALVVDAGYYNFGGGQAVDGRVIKAVLLNSARKTAGWTNHMTLAGGVYTTSQALDYSVGAGMLDLDRAYDQYLGGSANVTGLGGGAVSPVGWAFGHVSRGTPNDYFINETLHAGEVFTATLAWFANVAFDSNTQIASDVSFDQLGLQLWRVNNGVLTTLVAESADLYDAEQHIYFGITADDSYALEVFWKGRLYDIPGDTPEADDYGLAWSAGYPDEAAVLPENVPEPASLLVILAGFWVVRKRRGGTSESTPKALSIDVQRVE